MQNITYTPSDSEKLFKLLISKKGINLRELVVLSGLPAKLTISILNDMENAGIIENRHRKWYIRINVRST